MASDKVFLKSLALSELGVKMLRVRIPTSRGCDDDCHISGYHVLPGRSRKDIAFLKSSKLTGQCFAIYRFWTALSNSEP